MWIVLTVPDLNVDLLSGIWGDGGSGTDGGSSQTAAAR